MYVSLSAVYGKTHMVFRLNLSRAFKRTNSEMFWTTPPHFHEAEYQQISLNLGKFKQNFDFF